MNPVIPMKSNTICFAKKAKQRLLKISSQEEV